LNDSRRWTRETREYTFEALTRLGYHPIPSHTSFMLFPLKMEGQPYLDQMFDHGIGVRVFEVDNSPWCRVSMGTMKEMEMFIDSFKKVVG
ncbi:MAG: histidinol phosphate aminotransferase, partial [Bacteroidota bacterium]